MWSIAYTYHFPSSDIGNMDIDELYFWATGVRWISEKINKK